MAQAKPEGNTVKKNPASSDFSLVQAGGADSILKNCSWPKQEESSADFSRSTSAAESFQSNQILASHYALSTAYARVTKKLAEAEQRNQQLMLQDNFRSAKMSGSGGSQTNVAMPPDLEASVNQAWEAYNEKCKECQQLREELECVKQKIDQAEHHSRIQNLEEDVLREKAKQDDVVRKLEKTKMEADHLEKKEILAREELEKEREYQRSIIQSTEKKHKEMEQRIDELERSLANEKCLTEDLRKREKERQMVLEDDFNAKKEIFVAKVRELEEQNIALKEEVSVLVSMQSSSFNGPTVLANGAVHPGASHSGNFENGKDASLLHMDVQSLKAELNELKTRAAEQSHILSALFQNPKIITLLRSIDQLQNKTERTSLQPTSLTAEPKQTNGDFMLRRTKADSLKVRNTSNHVPNNGRQTVDSSSAPYQDIYSSSGPNPRTIFPKSFDEGGIPMSVPVLKSTEEFIRGLNQDASRQNRKKVKAVPRNDGAEYSPLFPPMDVSRVIHTPESTPSNLPTHASSNFSDDFNPYPNPSQTTNSNNAPLNPSSRTQSSQYHNGNTAAYIRPLTNGQVFYPPIMNSLPAMDMDCNQYSPALPSLSGGDTLVASPVDKTPSLRPTNPFYKDLTESQAATTTMLSVKTPTGNRTPTNTTEVIPNLNRNSKQPNANLKNLMELDNDLPSPSRLPQGVGDTPTNRYMSSDEDNDSATFMQPHDGHQPKEFVVPKVVRAPDLAAHTTQSRRAFQDSGYNAPAAQVPPRPAIRAKPESASTQARPSRHENGAMSLPQQHPSGSGRSPKKNQEGAARTCPICQFPFTPEWSEEKMTRHINAHFSDEENNEDILSLN